MLSRTKYTFSRVPKTISFGLGEEYRIQASGSDYIVEQLQDAAMTELIADAEFIAAFGGLSAFHPQAFALARQQQRRYAESADGPSRTFAAYRETPERNGAAC